MLCSVNGCGREARYKGMQLCQKHYFRMWRNGKIETKLEEKKRILGYTRVYRVTIPGKGYQRLYEPDHPLRDSHGYVAEHRMVVFADIGWDVPPCELCGKPLDWKTCHIDHIDRDVTNNNRSNLRPLCRVCNTTRDYPEQHTLSKNRAITIDGVTMTPEEWSRRPDVLVSGTQIRKRLNAGMSEFDAVFAPKKTHNGKITVDKRPRKTEHKHQRKNAVSITIDGVTKTAAEWSRDPRCSVSSKAIIFRIRSGWSREDAVLVKNKRKAQ